MWLSTTALAAELPVCEVDWTAPPAEVDLGVQPQGEAVAFLGDGSLVSTSEGEPLQMWQTTCLAPAEATCPGCGCDGAGAAGVGLFALSGGWGLRGRRAGASKEGR